MRSSDLILGIIAIVLLAALTWYATGFWSTLLLVSWLLFVRLLLLHLLGKDSRLAKTGAVLLLPSTIFVFFLPRRLKNQMQELRSRERELKRFPDDENGDVLGRMQEHGEVTPAKLPRT